jgi:uncharacterized integral membrane protein
MIVLLATLALGLIFSYFALQNTQPVTVRLENFVFGNIPLYMVAIGSMLLGILLSLIISLTESITSAINMYGKDRKIKKTEDSLQNLETRIHELEAENARLRRNSHQPTFRQSAFEKPNFFQKMRHRLSV